MTVFRLEEDHKVSRYSGLRSQTSSSRLSSGPEVSEGPLRVLYVSTPPWWSLLDTRGVTGPEDRREWPGLVEGGSEAPRPG